jgi:serine protease Do
MKKWAFILTFLAVGVLLGAYLLGPILHGQIQQPQPQGAKLAEAQVSYRDVVKAVLPAIVSLEAENTRNVGKAAVNPVPQFDESQIPEEFRKFFKEFQKKLPVDGLDVPPVGFGSGFLVSPDGVVMTNNHVVRGSDRVTVNLLDGRKFITDKIFQDPKTDLAIVKFDTRGEKMPFLAFGDSDLMEIGDPVLAFGAPFGLRGSVTHGIVSAKGRTGLNLNMYEDFLQTDAAINPGNSGGPLVNMQGQVIGINAAIKTKTGGFNGVGLAVASNLAKKIKDGLLKDGVVKRGYLGVRIKDLEFNVAEKLDIAKGTGVVVNEVLTNTPASRGGLKAGDVIVKIDGKTITDSRMLQMVVAYLPLNKSAPFEIFRDGRQVTVPVTIEEQPAQFGLAETTPGVSPSVAEQATSLDEIGISVSDLNPQTANSFGFGAATQGVVITDVKVGSIGHLGGLRAGMLILKINNDTVTSVSAVQRALTGASLARGVLLQVRTSQGGTNYVLLQAQTK